jgi:hypothetical protein
VFELANSSSMKVSVPAGEAKKGAGVGSEKIGRWETSLHTEAKTKTEI